MIQVTFCSKQLFEKKNEVDVSLRLPADAETMKRYLEAAGVKDMDDLLISDFRIHESTHGAVENIRNGIKLILTS